MHAYETTDLLQATAGEAVQYHEFLHVPAMSAGLYRLAADAGDPQPVHTEDEIYIVMQGEGQIRVGSEDRQVGSGSVVYVPAGVAHRFHSIARDLAVLAVFAPAEGSAAV